MNRAISRTVTGYTEKHHIIPKSFYINKSKTGWLEGNPEDISNKVNLTAKEHFLCHLLLTKMTTGMAKTKMSFAIAILSRSKKLQNKVTSRTYAYIKKLHSAASSITHKGVAEKHVVSLETRQKISKAKTGKKLSEETKKKMRKPKTAEHKLHMTGRITTDATRKKLSKSRVGKKASDETRIKQSLSAKCKPAISIETRKKLSESKKGNKLSETHKNNLSLMQKNLPRVCCLHCKSNIDSRTFNRFHNNYCKKESSS